MYGEQVHYLNSPRKAVIQKANSIDVDNVDLIQVQNYPLSDLFHFRVKIDDVRTSKLTGQTKSRPMLLTNPYDFQRHRRSLLTGD
jgi:hypothetical protein